MILRAAILLSTFLCLTAWKGNASEFEPTATLTDESSLAHCIGGATNAVFELASERLGLCFQTDDPNHDFSLDDPIDYDLAHFGGGLALADVDNNGSLELYVTYSRGIPGELFEYRGGTFQQIDGNRGIQPSELEYGGYFIDLDADGWKDFISVQRNGVEVFLNDGVGRFNKDELATGIFHRRSTTSMAAADIDLDGDLDLVFGHWGSGWRSTQPLSEYLWLNDGEGRFFDYSSKLPVRPTEGSEHSFTPTFAHINGDGFVDLLMAGDFRSSQVFVNVAGRHFEDVTTAEITDENGMGAAVADFDQDGDMDWFVSSIYGDPANFGDLYSGNRFYVNENGEGRFVDRTDTSRTRFGGWGWGSCAEDFNNDGLVDLFHTNGSELFRDDRSVLFIADGRGGFNERSEEYGIEHTDQGRGVLCDDLDGDGRVDILIANNGKSPTVYVNRNRTGNHYLQVDLRGLRANREAIGARVTVAAGNRLQVKEVRLGTGYLAQGLARLHFGLGSADVVQYVEVEWPDYSRSRTRLLDVPADQLVVLEQPSPTPFALHVLDGIGTGFARSGEEVYIQADPPPKDHFFSHWSVSGNADVEDRFAKQTTMRLNTGSVSVRANYLPSSRPVEELSVVRLWNEVVLEAIRNDFARPPIHARNLFHIFAATYDLWSFLNETGDTWLVNNRQGNSECRLSVGSAQFEGEAVVQVAISHAVFRLIRHRFNRSPGLSRTMKNAHTLMDYLQLDPNFASDDYTSLSPAALGNYVAGCYIEFGLQDRANEVEDYANRGYRPRNPPLLPHKSGNPDLEDFDRWQPLALRTFIDQAGNPAASEPEFIGAEWGRVVPFALTEHDLKIHERDGVEYWLYHDPGSPPRFDGNDADAYKWGFALVAQWSSQLDPSDGVEMDISPASIGGDYESPRSLDEYRRYFDGIGSNELSGGYEMNPVTGEPYKSQLVARGDYTRALAEFWADGPDSETPPGHWFVILNEVNDHAQLIRRVGGIGPVLERLEWDLKTYFALGAAMHDAAIAAWGVKGWYDSIRPISAIRGMAERGQSSDPNLQSYDRNGIPLIEGHIEVVEAGDQLAGENGENIDEIKLLAWRGPSDEESADSGGSIVEWVLARDWWPYQRPTFVTPPFAGYVSGHSTFSRAAAETLTALTGSEFFPGGASSFEIKAGEYLEFEPGPSTDLILQWATYRDAADQCALSRIWGGIHPPHDDIPGRELGKIVGEQAVRLAISMFDETN